MPVIVPNTVRYAVNQRYGLRPVVNILDMDLNPELSETREEAIFRVAGDIINNWSDHVLLGQVNNMTALSVSWVDLDSADGTTGQRTATSANTWPMNGAGTGDAMPGNVAMRVIKEITRSRGRRNGRMYICGVSEPSTDDSAPNTLTAGTLGDQQNRMNDFLDGINDIEGPNTTAQKLVVVSHPPIPEGGGVTVIGSKTPVQRLSVDPTLATQRRRLRG